jgi:NTP pyrophosphatase (non-canonical NTP hydrolase)
MARSNDSRSPAGEPGLRTSPKPDTLENSYDDATGSRPDNVARSTISFAALHAAHLLRRHRWHATESRAWSIAEWTNALCGEAGEAANIAKKLLRYDLGITGNRGEDQQRQVLTDKLARELADVVHYAVITAERAGVDLEQALVDTFNDKSEQLGFPERLQRGATSLPDPS